MYLAGTIPAPAPTTRGSLPAPPASTSSLAAARCLQVQNESLPGTNTSNSKANPGASANADVPYSSEPPLALNALQVHARGQEHRKRTRQFLGQCLHEINNLTYAQTLHPVPGRALLASVAGSGSSENDEVTGSAGDLNNEAFISSAEPLHQAVSAHAPLPGAAPDARLAGENTHSADRYANPSNGSPSVPSASSEDNTSAAVATTHVPADHEQAPAHPSYDLPSQIWDVSTMQRPGSVPRTRHLDDQRGTAHERDTTRAAAGDSESTAPPDSISVSHASDAETESEAQHWKPGRVLRHHLDTVRSIAFDETRLSLVSGSDDGSVKYWNLDPASPPAPTGVLDRGLDSPLAPPPTAPVSESTSSDIQPVVTYRGHSAGVTSVLVSSLHQRVYSGALDATIRVWKAPSDDTLLFAPFEPDSEVAILGAHTDAVWGLAFLPATARAAAAQVAAPVSGGMRITEQGYLASISADGTTKVWDLLAGKVPALRMSWDYHGSSGSSGTSPESAERETSSNVKASLPVPTAVAAYPSDWRLCIVGYSNGITKMFEIETGKAVGQYGVEDSTENAQVNQVAVHPTLPLLFTAHGDGWMRLVHLDTGESHGLKRHDVALAALDLDPAGLTLASGGADGHVRFWDLTPRGPDEPDEGLESASSSSASSRSTSLSSVPSVSSSSGARHGSEGKGGTSNTPATKNEPNAVAGRADWADEYVAVRLGSQVVCVQELEAHEPNAYDGVLAVAYHRSASHFASAGADGLIRMYH